MPWLERGGRGESCFLLVHGLGATGAVWSGLCALLDREALGRWILLDLPGHGASPRAESYSVGALAGALAPLLEQERPIIIGHSLGAHVALALASGWFGVRVAGVLGIGPKITWTPLDLAAMNELARKPARVFASEEEALERYRKVSGLDERIAPGAAALARGEHDALVTLPELREHRAQAQDIAGRGHNVHVEAPEALLPLVRRIADTSLGGR
jgi:pimeloyl-ACP methyl ester carboxylesterase